MTVTVALPWPPRALWPNARGHWTRKAKASKQYRDDATLSCIMQRVPNMAAPVAARITFFPPDKRARDLDNMLAAIKAGIDAIATRIAVDDQHWSMTIGRGEVRKGGAVVVEIDAEP